jgi:uncharacterized protein (DUF1778 family)
LTPAGGGGLVTKPVPKKPKGEALKVRLDPDQRRLFMKAASLVPADFSTFCRIAMTEKVERMRAEGKKL